MWVFSCFLLHKIWADSGWQQLVCSFTLPPLNPRPPSSIQLTAATPHFPPITKHPPLHSSQWSLRCFKIAMLRDASQRLYEEPNHTHLMLQDCYVPPRKMSLWRILWDSLGGILVRSISMATTLTISTFWKWVSFNFVIVYIFVCVYFKLKIEYFYIFSLKSIGTDPNRAVEDIWAARAKGDQADALALQLPEKRCFYFYHNFQYHYLI